MITLDQAVEKTAAVIDEHNADAFRAFEVLLGKRGATTAEIERELEWYAVQLTEHKAKNLADVRKWLQREGEALQ